MSVFQICKNAVGSGLVNSNFEKMKLFCWK